MTTVFTALLCAAGAVASSPAMLELSGGCIMGDSSAPFIGMIREEIGMRVSANASLLAKRLCGGKDSPVVHVGIGSRIRSRCSSSGVPARSGSFVLAVDDGVVSLTAVDTQGLQAGTGRLLRELRMPARWANGKSVGIPGDLCVVHDAVHERWAIRGHQIPQAYLKAVVGGQPTFTQFAKDLAVFGTNRLELSHISAPLPIDVLANFSSVARTAGMGVSMWIGVDKLSANHTEMVEAFRRMEQVTVRSESACVCVCVCGGWVGGGECMCM
jgi:hypothetical protein